MFDALEKIVKLFKAHYIWHIGFGGVGFFQIYEWYSTGTVAYARRLDPKIYYIRYSEYPRTFSFFAFIYIGAAILFICVPLLAMFLTRLYRPRAHTPAQGRSLL
jgi:hypothetical protein